MSPFGNIPSLGSRLIKEYKQHGNICVAFDFDNTLYNTHNDRTLDARIVYAQTLARHCLAFGLDVVIWTCRNDKDFIQSFIRSVGINPKTPINVNKAPYTEITKSIKPFFSVLLDDRSGLEESMQGVHELLSYIEHKDK